MSSSSWRAPSPEPDPERDPPEAGAEHTAVYPPGMTAGEAPPPETYPVAGPYQADPYAAASYGVAGYGSATNVERQDLAGDQPVAGVRPPGYGGAPGQGAAGPDPTRPAGPVSAAPPAEPGFARTWPDGSSRTGATRPGGQRRPQPGRAGGSPFRGLLAGFGRTGGRGGPGHDTGHNTGGGAGGRAGRDVPVAIAVGLGLGLMVLASVLLYRPLFVAVVAVAVVVALWELTQALTANEIVLPVLPVATGGVAMIIAAYAGGGDALAVAVAVTALAVMVWRMLEGPRDYLRDMTAGVFATLYLPFLASFAVLLLTPRDGAARVLLFFILTICNDTAGFVAGVRFGRHPMAPSISPKKSWEGLAGSVLAAGLAGALGVTLMLGGSWWQGVLVGLGTVLSATLGDLIESMIKRDLGIKDMGRLLPGHGGLMDRLDSLLSAAPVTWLLLTVLVAVH